MTAFAEDQTLEIALTLAAMRGVTLSDEAILRRYRLDFGRWAMSIRRRFRIATQRSAETLTVEEARHVLEIEAVDGEVIDVLDRYVEEFGLWLAAIDPAVDLAARVEALTGVGAAELARRFRDELGVDLAQRTLEGTPWLSLPIESGWFTPKVVEVVREPNVEIALADAQRIDASVQLGAELKIRSPIRVLEWRPARPVHEPPMHDLESPTETQVEQLRSTAEPVPTPPALARFELGALRSFYPGGAHGVLFADLAREDVESKWRALDKAATKTGYRPLVLFGEQRGYPPVDDLVVARFAWQQDPLEGLQAGTHRADSPEVVLAEVERVDVEALLAAGGNPSYPDWRLKSGPWVPSAPRRPLGAVRAERVRLLLVPVDAAWKTLAYFPILTTSGEATPSLAQAAAVSRRWEQAWGARVAAIGPAMIEWIAPPIEPGPALDQLAVEHHAFSPEAYEDKTIEERVSKLVVAGTWYAWWD